eukprot:scaffold3998_cov162-Amphora_coffeaeformis.AAC.2
MTKAKARTGHSGRARVKSLKMEGLDFKTGPSSSFSLLFVSAASSRGGFTEAVSDVDMMIGLNRVWGGTARTTKEKHRQSRQQRE